MSDTLAGIISVISTTVSLGFVGYATASVAIVSGAIALSAISALAGIGLFVIGFQNIRK
ncbi:MAG: hypothetical protein KME49_22795 [Brasilonema octagenarum HA4186-MV1]|jgi:hypothetical protein|nr:hypothetical protein [Brasilonema octagenarum HA4186-MV1]